MLETNTHLKYTWCKCTRKCIIQTPPKPKFQLPVSHQLFELQLPLDKSPTQVISTFLPSNTLFSFLFWLFMSAEISCFRKDEIYKQRSKVLLQFKPNFKKVKRKKVSNTHQPYSLLKEYRQKRVYCCNICGGVLSLLSAPPSSLCFTSVG